MAHVLDYTAFSEPLTDKDLQTHRHISPHPIWKRLAISTVILVVFFVSYWVASRVSYVNEAVAIVWLILAAIGATILLALVPIALWLSGKRKARLTEAIVRHDRFAARNNLVFIHNHAAPEYNGVIFAQGYNRVITKAFRFHDGIELGNYSYSISSHGGGNRMYRWSYAKVKLTRRLPHILLDSRQRSLFNSQRMGLIHGLRRAQRLELEGDFNKYFTLYAPNKYERDAFYIFTPDVMVAMIDHGKDYDIEIVDDELFIYAHGHAALNESGFYVHMLAVIDAIRSELVHQTDYYADERVANRNLNTVANQGRRLDASIGVGTIILIIVYIIVSTILESRWLT